MPYQDTLKKYKTYEEMVISRRKNVKILGVGFTD